MTATSIDKAEVSCPTAARFDGDGNPVSGTGQGPEIRAEAEGNPDRAWAGRRTSSGLRTASR